MHLVHAFLKGTDLILERIQQVAQGFLRILFEFFGASLEDLLGQALKFIF